MRIKHDEDINNIEEVADVEEVIEDVDDGYSDEVAEPMTMNDMNSELAEDVPEFQPTSLDDYAALLAEAESAPDPYAKPEGPEGGTGWKEPESAEFTLEEIFEAQGCNCQRCGRDLSTDTTQINIKLVDERGPHDASNILLLCNRCTEKFDRERLASIHRFRGRKHFEAAATEILQGISDMGGFLVDDDNFHNTPKRFARAYQEIFEGCENLQEQVDDILSTTFPANGDDTMVVAKDIIVFSMCPHHLLPVEYHVCVGYIPNKNGRVLGISKLARLVEVLAKRPVLQESFTQEIVNALDNIGVYGAIALVEGQHMCMRMRGAKALGTTITTTAVAGIFSDDRSSKSEFLSVIDDRMKFRA